MFPVIIGVLLVVCLLIINIHSYIFQRNQDVHRFLQVLIKNANWGNDPEWIMNTFVTEKQYWKMVFQFWKPLKLESWWSPEEIQKLHSGGGN